MTTEDEAHRILADPGTSRWLYHALRAALEGDLVDVVRDCERLLHLLGRRLAEAKTSDTRGKRKTPL